MLNIRLALRRNQIDDYICEDGKIAVKGLKTMQFLNLTEMHKIPLKNDQSNKYLYLNQIAGNLWVSKSLTWIDSGILFLMNNSLSKQTLFIKLNSSLRLTKHWAWLGRFTS